MIVYSAIKYTGNHPIVVTGFRHADIYESLTYTYHLPIDKEIITEGFWTDDNRFLDRYEAKIEARRCNQLVEDTDDRALCSEDIWPEED